MDLALLTNAIAQSRHTGRSVVMQEARKRAMRSDWLHGGVGRCDSLVISHLCEPDAIEIRNLERSTVALSIAKLRTQRREAEKVIPFRRSFAISSW